MQKTPFVVADIYLTHKIGPMKKFEKVSGLAAKLSLDSETPKEEKKAIIIRAATAYVINDVQERANRIFDKLVLESIGINSEIYWRNQPRQLIPVICHDPQMLVALPITGDPFKNFTDQEAVDRFIEWEKYCRSVMPYPSIDRLLKSFKELDVKVVPLQDLKEEYEDAHAKYQEEQRRKEELRRFPRKEERRKKRR